MGKGNLVVSQGLSLGMRATRRKQYPPSGLKETSALKVCVQSVAVISEVVVPKLPNRTRISNTSGGGGCF